MGKKVKKKTPNPRKVLHRSENRKAESDEEGETVKEACTHYKRSTAELNKILLKIQNNSKNVESCEHCREEPAQTRGSKQNKKKGKSKASEVKKETTYLWVCLDCNRYFCGGEVSITEPYGHARRHSKQEKHPWAVRSDDLLISWCYACESKVPIEMPVEEVCDDPKPLEEPDNASESTALGSTRGYVVRGLSNLGNTCFFNSVMQNLLATDVLRDYLLSSERPFGPITMAMRKLFVESCLDSKGVMTPKGLFGSICAKQPQFRGYQQQDSHELLRYLLAGLDMEESSYRKSFASSDEPEKVDKKPALTFVDSIFGGQISSTVCCMECGFTSVVHEPFLDLSIPVPSKKPPIKKAPPLPPKRSKVSVREKNKGRKIRERTTVKIFPGSEDDKEETSCAKDSPACENGKEESSDLPIDHNVPVAPAQDQVEVVSLETDDNATWMDILDDGYSMSFADNDDTCLDIEQIPQSESNTECTSDVQLKNCSVNVLVPSESGWDDTQDNMIPLSCVEDAKVPLHTFEESNLATEGINDTASSSQPPETVDFVDAPGEEDFAGFGDMFNEPEVTSFPKRDAATGEETDLVLWTGNSSDSNHDEVDNTNSPVSVNSCLALFTKPELLTDEQAWHCERCSENLGPKAGKLKAVATLDEGKLKGKESLSTLEVESSVLEVIGNGEMASNSKYLVSEKEGLDDASTAENAFHKPLDIGEGSGNLDIQDDGISNSLGPDVDQMDQYAVESDTSSQYKSCSSSGNNITHEISVSEGSGFCSMNDLDGDGCDKEQECSSSNACEVDTKIIVDQPVRKSRGRKSGDEVKSETKKVKRDATKRILIYRIPPILTIHLKRFSQDARGRLSKMSGHVGFSEALDLRPYMDPRCEEKDKCQYRLIGVVEHSGSMSGGHYVAYVRGQRGRGKAQKGNAWFYASDGHVREVTLSEVLSSDAYILFYERVLN